MKHRKTFQWVGYIGPAGAILMTAFFLIQLCTPITVTLPDGTTISSDNSFLCPKALAAGSGYPVSGMHGFDVEDGEHRLTSPLLVCFRGPDGFTRYTFTYASTVGGFLADAGIDLGPFDIVAPGVEEKVPGSGEIRLTRVEVSLETAEEEIPYNLILEPESGMAYGKEEIITVGINGTKEVTYRIRRENGSDISRTIVAEKIVKPAVDQHARVSIGWKRDEARQLLAKDVIWMDATAYDPGYESNGKWTGMPTAYGLKVGYGVVAVDPRVIPLGTSLYIEGYGYAIAGDTGGAIKKMRIDLGYNTRPEALRFGRREVKVYILD